MSFIICVFLFVGYFVTKEPMLLIASGLFAVAMELNSFKNKFSDIIEKVEVSENE